MEPITKKRLYDEKYDASPVSKSLKGIYNIAERSLDRVADSDYKQYRNTKRGINDISKLSTKELKFMARDFKIKGIENPKLKNEISFRKERKKVLAKNKDITPIYSFKSKDQNFNIGYDHKKKQPVISTRFHNDDKRLPVWRSLKQEDLKKELQQFGPLSSFDISKTNTSQFKNDKELTMATQSLNTNLEKQISISVSKQQFVPLNHKTLSNPESLIGKNIQILDLNNEKASFKVLAADKDNLTLERVFGTDNNYRLLNVNKEMTKNIAATTKTTAILDSKTVMGYNKENDTTYIGSITKDNSIKWQTKEDYKKGLSPTGKTSLEQNFKEGLYATPDIKQIGITPKGNKIYEVQMTNNTKAITANLDKFHDINSPEAKHLKDYVKQNKTERSANQKGESENKNKEGAVVVGKKLAVEVSKIIGSRAIGM